MRLIDADAIAYTYTIARDLEDGHNWDIAAVGQDEIDDMPTIDAVPVVRCGECKHRFVDGDNVRYNVCMLNHNKVQPDDWFCADGERKDGADSG